MNILFISLGGLGDLSENAVYPDLLRLFRDSNHSIFVVCQSERRFGLPTQCQTEVGIQVLRVKTLNITKTNFFEKGLASFLIGYQFKRAINDFYSNIKFDLVLYTTPPITIANLIRYIKKRDSSFTYLMLKDIFPQNALDLGILNRKGIKGVLTKYYFGIEKKLYLISDKIGCMSQANVDYILRNNSYLISKKIEICPNTIDPIEKNEQDKACLKRHFGLPQDKVIFVYGGNIGKPQNVNFILEVLKGNETQNDRHFVFCGGGTDFHFIQEYSPRNKNVTVFNSMQKQQYEMLLDSCDIGLVFLDYRFSIPNFPSRLLDYMNHSIPVLASTDLCTDVKNLILDSGLGWWCESDSAQKYQEILNYVCINKSEIKTRGLAGKKVLIEKFDTKIAYNRIISSYSKGFNN
jgi:glycosyltransferase involved in cell wall biosynthesis